MRSKLYMITKSWKPIWQKAYLFFKQLQTHSQESTIVQPLNSTAKSSYVKNRTESNLKETLAIFSRIRLEMSAVEKHYDTEALDHALHRHLMKTLVRS